MRRKDAEVGKVVVFVRVLHHEWVPTTSEALRGRTGG